MGTRRHDGAIARAARARTSCIPDVYILSARNRPDAALQRAGHADLVETPDGRDLHGLSLRPAAAQSRALHARPRNGDSADDVGRRRLAAHGGRRGHSSAGGARASRSAAAADSSRRRCGRTSTRHAADRFPWLRSPWPDELVQSHGARPGHLRLFGRETHRQSLPSGAGRAAAAGTLLQRATLVEFEPDTSSRWPAWSATTTARSSTTSTSRATSDCGKHLRVMSALPDQVMADVFTPPIAVPDGGPIELRGRGGLRAAAVRVSRRGRGSGSGCRSSSTPASCRTKPRAPGLAEFHRRLRRHGVPGPGRHRDAGGLRLLRVSRAGIRRRRCRSLTGEAEQREQSPRALGVRPRTMRSAPLIDKETLPYWVTALHVLDALIWRSRR